MVLTGIASQLGVFCSVVVVTFVTVVIIVKLVTFHPFMELNTC